MPSPFARCTVELSTKFEGCHLASPAGRVVGNGLRVVEALENSPSRERKPRKIGNRILMENVYGLGQEQEGSGAGAAGGKGRAGTGSHRHPGGP